MKKRCMFLFFSAFFALISAGCFHPDRELAGYFSPELFWSGKDTPAQYMTDRLNDPAVQQAVRDLSGKDVRRQETARENLSRLRELIEFGKAWQLPRVELSPAPAKTAPVIDGEIKFSEWKGAVEIPGSCRAGRKRRNFDGSRFLLMYDKDHLYLAAFFPWNTPKEKELTEEDHVLLYVDTGKWEYREYALFPAKKIPLLCTSWAYCGNGSRVRTGSPESGIVIRHRTNRFGYSIESAIPLKLLFQDPDHFIRLGLLRWDKTIQDYRTPIAFPYHGHDLFNRIRIRPLPRSIAVRL